MDALGQRVGSYTQTVLWDLCGGDLLYSGTFQSWLGSTVGGIRAYVCRCMDRAGQ